MDYNYKTPNSNLNLKLNEDKLQELLYNFCHIDSNDHVVLNYKYFKIVSNIIDNNNILNYLIFIVEHVLKNLETFVAQVHIENLTILEIDKNKDFIRYMCNILKDKFPDKLEICYIHDAPFIFKQIYTFLSLIIDKKTLTKIKLKQ
jgi:hypothetical protein